MGNLLPAVPAAAPLHADLSSLSSEVARYIEVGLQGSANTQRGYLSDLRNFTTYCESRGLSSLPATTGTVVQFVAVLADGGRLNISDESEKRKPCKLSTIRRHLAAIYKQHQLAGYSSAINPEGVNMVMDGITRVKGKKQRQAPAFTIEHLRDVIRGLDLTTPAGLRDRALLLLGFAGAFRRSELVALNVEQLEMRREALLVHLLQSKTNQYGEVEDKAVFYSGNVLYCPVRAVQDWLEVLGRTEGPLFVSLTRTSGKPAQPSRNRLSAHRVNMLVQQHLGPTYSAHSLRASFVTISVQRGKPNQAIKNQTKQKTDAMIERYSRLNDVMAFNAAQDLGL